MMNYRYHRNWISIDEALNDQKKNTQINKQELIDILESETDNCVLFFKHNNQELVINHIEYGNDGNIYFNLMNKSV